MILRFYLDPESGEPHIHAHEVFEDEIDEVLSDPAEERRGPRNSRIAIGQTHAGRYLRVVYVPDAVPHSVFVVTAYELSSRQLAAHKRRRRKKRP